MTTHSTEEPKPQVSTNAERDQSVQLAVRIFSGLILLALLLILFFVKKSNPDFNIGWVIGISIGLILLYCIIFFGNQIVKYFIDKNNEGKDKVPDPITLEEARLIVKNELLKPAYADYVDDLSGDGVCEYGNPKNKVYYLFGEGYHFKGKYLVVLNMNYPESVIIKKEGTVADFHRFKQEIVHSEKEDEPNKEESIMFDPLTERTHVHRKVGRPPKEPTKESKEDL